MSQGSLIAFQSQNVADSGLNNTAGDVLLTAHGIDCNYRCYEAQEIEQFRNSGNLIRFVGDNLLL